MKKLLVFPTWLLVRFFIPFLPEEHIWKGRKFSLSDWSYHSTKLNIQFGTFFWVAGIGVIGLIVNMFL